MVDGSSRMFHAEIKMAATMLLRRVFGKNITNLIIFNTPASCQLQPIRSTQSWVPVEKPMPDKHGLRGKSYRRFVHYEDDYTVKPLSVTNLGGRDPITGMKSLKIFFLL